MSRIAIIPARGGSKRIPGKNIKEFCGQPIIAYSIKAAINSGLFQEVMVSTDDAEIATIAQQYGASVPFIRSIQAADDYAPLADVISEVLADYKNKENKTFKQFACILPTAPFISKERLIQAFKLLDEKALASVFPVLRYSYPIQRALQINSKTQHVEMVWPENLHKRSQDFEPRFHDSGQFYCGNTHDFIKEETLFMKKSGIIELSEMEVQDIDTPEDWKIAELKFKLLKQNV